MCLKELYTMCSFLLLIPFSLQLAVTKVTGVKCSTDVLYREGWYDRKPFCPIHLHRIRYFRRNHRKVFLNLNIYNKYLNLLEMFFSAFNTY